VSVVVAVAVVVGVWVAVGVRVLAGCFVALVEVGADGGEVGKE
jgi:hypothetical protein